MFKGNRSENHDDENNRDTKVKELKAALGPLSERSTKFCTESCLRRYLEAKTWNVDDAKKMLEETLIWRASYKPEEIRWHEVAKDSETGKISRANFHDREGRTVLIIRHKKKNSKSREGAIRLFVYMMENAILNLPEGQNEICWLKDYTGYWFNSNVPTDSPDMIKILLNHYPGRLGVQFLYNMPWTHKPIEKMFMHFADGKTRQKVKYLHPKSKENVEVMMLHFDVENLPKEFGGNVTLEYDHEEFSKMMLDDDAKTSKFWGIDDSPRHASTSNG